MSGATQENVIASLQLAVQDVVRELMKSLPEAVPLAPTIDAELRGKLVGLKLKIRDGMVVMGAAIPAAALLNKVGRAAIVAKFRPPLSQLTYAWGCGFQDAKRVLGADAAAKKKAAAEVPA